MAKMPETPKMPKPEQNEADIYRLAAAAYPPNYLQGRYMQASARLRKELATLEQLILQLQEGQMVNADDIHRAATAVTAAVPGVVVAIGPVLAQLGELACANTSGMYSVLVLEQTTLWKKANEAYNNKLHPNIVDAAGEENPLYTKHEFLKLAVELAEQGKEENHE